jgi:hypothetical protein
MKCIFLLISLFIIFSIQAQTCDEQVKIIEIVIKDKSLSTFFKNKSKVIVSNTLCDTVTKHIEINSKDIPIDFINSNINADNTISFLEYETTDRIVFAQFTLFNKNVIHSVLLKKRLNEFILLNKWTTFIKSEN